MKEIEVSEITKSIKEMCIEINHELSSDMQKKLYEAAEHENHL